VRATSHRKTKAASRCARSPSYDRPAPVPSTLFPGSRASPPSLPRDCCRDDPHLSDSGNPPPAQAMRVRSVCPSVKLAAGHLLVASVAPRTYPARSANDSLSSLSPSLSLSRARAAAGAGVRPRDRAGSSALPPCACCQTSSRSRASFSFGCPPSFPAPHRRSRSCYATGCALFRPRKEGPAKKVRAGGA
jgi:hypothetical protein